MRPSDAPGGGRLASRVACVATLAAIAGLEFRRVFGWGPVAPRVLGAAVLAACVPWLLCRTRLNGVAASVTASVLALVAYLFVVTQVVVPVASPDGLVGGLVSGWSRILTISVPAPARGDLLVVPVLITWVATLVAVELTLRTRLVLGTVVPSAVAYVVALLFTVGTVGSRVAPVVVWVALALAVVRLGDRAPDGATDGRPSAPGEVRRRWRRKIVLPVAAALVGVVVLAAVVGSNLPGAGSATPYDPREHRSPPTDDLSAVNPMTLVSQWARNPDVELFTVDAAAPAAWQMATLDRYDGAAWTADTRYTATGEALPTDPGRSGAAVDRLVQRVTIAKLGGVWLPAAAWPISLRGVGAFVDPASGTLAVKDGLRPGLAYSVTSERLTSTDCTTATVGVTATVDIPVSDENAPFVQGISSLAQRIGAGTTSPCARARALEQYLVSNYRFDPAAPAGSHLRILSDFLTVPERGSGTSEQFAASFALLGRYLGLPTRVVVGFHAGSDQGGGKWLVKSGDGFAWPEVRFDGLGWVAFDPTPQSDAAPKPPEKVAEEEAQADQPTDPDAPTSPQVVERVTDQQKAAAGTSFWARLATGVAVGLGALLVLFGMAVTLAGLGRSRRRRRRRQAPGVRRQVVGAWWEALDALEDRGLGADRGRTAAQWVGAGEDLCGAEAVGDLATLAAMVNEALFSAAPPDPALVERSWALAGGVGVATRVGMSRVERLRRLVDPRPWTAPVPPALDDSVTAAESVSA